MTLLKSKAGATEIQTKLVFHRTKAWVALNLDAPLILDTFGNTDVMHVRSLSSHSPKEYKYRKFATS